MKLFLPRDAMLARLLWSYVCSAVRSSVRQAQTGIIPKGRNTGLLNNTTRQHSHSSFLLPKISWKFDWRHPEQGRQMQVV